jgi:ABC-type uncharacterized transport system substrate-binding protein
MGQAGRRRFLVAVGGLLALPSTQAMKRPARIGLSFRFDALFRHSEHAASMARLGWHEGKDYVFIEPPIPSNDFRKVREVITGVLSLRPDILVVHTGAHTAEAYRQTKTIPIVMFICGYPVEMGVADSLAHPGHNVTGNTIYAGTGIWGKLLELLKEVRPTAARVGVLWTYAPPAFLKSEIDGCLRDIRKSAAALGIAPNIVEAASEADGPQALDALGAAHPDALLLTALPYAFWKSWPTVMEFAVARRLPTIMDFPPVVGDPRPLPVMHYGPSYTELRDRAYMYVVRILKGAKPGDLPIQRPEKFDLVLNLESAKAIGLTLPQSLLVRANRVIE